VAFEIKKKLAINCRPPYCSGRLLLKLISYIMENKNENKMKTIIVTQEEIIKATRPNIYRNRKKYTRKDKHKKINE
jgi:DNA-directed RNA polymerase subunit RPC12/RpoP